MYRSNKRLENIECTRVNKSKPIISFNRTKEKLIYIVCIEKSHSKRKTKKLNTELKVVKVFLFSRKIQIIRKKRQFNFFF